MRLQSMRAAVGILGVAVLFVAADPGRAFAQAAEPKATDQKPANGDANKDKSKKPDNEYAEAEKVLGGPAANPECLWLGKRVVSLLYSDDLDTAFRHLDLYDRFGCPGGHVQMAFRCVVRAGDIDHKDPKVQDTMEKRVHACWLNPNTDPVISPPAAASATPPAPAKSTQ